MTCTISALQQGWNLELYGGEGVEPQFIYRVQTLILSDGLKGSNA